MDRQRPTAMDVSVPWYQVPQIELQTSEPDLTGFAPREELEIMGALAYAQAIWRGAGNPAAQRRDHEQLMLIAKLWLMLAEREQEWAPGI